uniref:ANF_receptor domain-containing protein n=1 Tax=Caenorhabditis tropicalis TaxID=1561998 RepID=A0A1I7TQK3_9PELO
MINQTNKNVGGVKMRAADLGKFKKEDWHKFYRKHYEFYKLICSDILETDFVLVSKKEGKITGELLNAFKKITLEKAKIEEAEKTETEEASSQTLEDHWVKVDESEGQEIADTEEAEKPNDLESEKKPDEDDALSRDFSEILNSLKKPESVVEFEPMGSLNDYIEQYGKELTDAFLSLTNHKAEVLEEPTRREAVIEEESLEPDPKFLRQLEEQRLAHQKELLEAKQRRAEKNKEFEEELKEIREKQKQCTLDLLNCIILKQRFEEKKQEEPIKTTIPGAIFREREDAHIEAALRYSVEWLSQRGIYGDIDLVIEYIDHLDHYDAIKKACKMLEKDHIVALLGGSHAALNAQLERITDDLEIPFLTAIDDLRTDAGKSKIDFWPRPQLFEAVVDMFTHWKWNRVVLVYEDDERIRRLEQLLESEEYASIRFYLIKVHDGDYMKAARQVKELEECRLLHRKDCSEFSRLLVDMNPEHTYNFLLASLQMGLIELKHWFLLTNMELSTMDMELFRYNHARFISPYPVDSTFLTENRDAFNFSHFKEHISEKWAMKTDNSRNLKMMEAVFTFDAVYTFANVFNELSSHMQMNDVPQTLCRKSSRNSRKYQHGRSLIDNIVHNDLHGLSGDLRRLNGHPLKSNFSMRIHLLGYSGRLDDSSTSFRPPLTWKDLLENDEFFTLFFKLHSKIRHDETLCTKSMNCLIQLASLTGDCMPVADQEASTKYVRMYISNLLELFAQGPSGCETNHFCLIINRMFLYRPLTSIMRQDAELRSRFFGFLRDYTIHLTNQAMHKAIGEAEHEDHTSLALIYDAIVVLLRGRWRTCFQSEAEADAIDNELVKWPVLQIVNAFIVNVLSPPKGTRPVAKDEDDGDDDSEDRTLFMDLFNPLGSMICYSVAEFMENMATNLHSSLAEFTSMATGSSDTSRLPIWQEDQHWLMLILANSVVGEEIDGACHVAGDVFDHTQRLFHAGTKFDEGKKAQYLQLCIEQPTQERAPYAHEVDPFVIVMGELFAWASIEHDVFSNASREMISPELCRSTFLCLRRFLNAASSPVDCDKWNDYQGVSAEFLPVMPKDKGFAAILVRFVVKKVLTVLINYGSEEKLCQDAIDCLLSLVESHASDIASSTELFEYLNSLDIARLPNRSNLMKALVLIGAAANDQELQENMFKLILVPLSERFVAAASVPSQSEVDSQIVDLLQCFDGVARASQSHSAPVLFKFLYSIIEKCIELMHTRSQNETVVSNILQLILDVTTKVSIYIDNEEESNALYSSLLQIVESYRNDQIKRFSTFTADDEDKAADLALFIDILSNVLSKDFLTLGEDNCSTGAKVVIHSLEMLLTIMNDRVLQMPEVALKFFRLILYLVEFSPESLAEMSDQLMSSLCQCIKLGMTGQFGMEITSTSLESLTEVVLHFGIASNKHRCTQNLALLFKEMLPTVFETCLSNTCENSIYAESCSALYAIIAFERVRFLSF